MPYKRLHNVTRHWFGPCSQKWIIQAALTRGDRTWSSVLLSRLSVWQTRCLKSTDSPYFSCSYMFIIFILLNFLCIWVSIFHVFCCRSLLLFVHASKLPDEVWQENEAEIFWDLSVRSWALVCLKSKMLLSHKKFQSLVGKSFQGWNTGFALYPYRIFFWIWRFPSFVIMRYPGTGLTRLAQLDVDPVGMAWSASNSSRYSRGLLGIQPSAVLWYSPVALPWMRSSV